MTDLTNKWYQAIRVSPDHTDDDEDPNTFQEISTSNSRTNLNPKI